jgi:CheY-like chemotaxis protein
LKILIVDDEPSSLKLASAVIEAAGHEVQGASDAIMALSLIESEKPALILMDLMLPGLDGLTFIRQLKEEATTADIQIIAITAYPDGFTKAAALDAGARGYLVKPLNTRAIIQMVDELAAVDD